MFFCYFPLAQSMLDQSTVYQLLGHWMGWDMALYIDRTGMFNHIKWCLFLIFREYSMSGLSSFEFEETHE